MSVSGKFEINPLSGLHGNVQKPQKCDEEMNRPMEQRTKINAWTNPFL